MTADVEHLKPHGIFGERTFEEHCSRLPEFYFKPEVPEDVRLDFEVVKKLVIFSYYEYKFLDVAFTKCLQTMEMAMRIRTKELDIYHPKDTFDPLLKKLSAKNIFESEYERLKHVKNIRNWNAHPEIHTVAGTLYWKRFEFFTFLINELYEDVELRLDRKAKFKEMEDKLQELSLEKNVMIEIDGKPTILNRFDLLFFNNKYSSPAYLFACTPLFDLTVEENGCITVPQSFVSKLVDLKISDGAIEGTSYKNRKKVKVMPIVGFPELAKECEKWNTEYDKYDESIKFRFESGRAMYYPEFIDPELREFQKM